MATDTTLNNPGSANTEPPPIAGVRRSFVEARGVRFHVTEAGPADGRPVIALHGWPQHWWCWRRLMPLLADRHRVLAMDLRGFGWSEPTRGGYRKEDLAEDVVGVLDALGVERANLVGHDWGGIVGEKRGGVKVNRSPAWAGVAVCSPSRSRVAPSQFHARNRDILGK